jgi:hypothetical protein
MLENKRPKYIQRHSLNPRNSNGGHPANDRSAKVEEKIKAGSRKGLEAGNQKVNLLNGLFSIDPNCDGLRTAPKPSKYFA